MTDDNLDTIENPDEFDETRKQHHLSDSKNDQDSESDQPAIVSDFGVDEFATVNDSVDLTDRQRSEGNPAVLDLGIPGYLILDRLGQGGMGAVYLAMDRKLQRQVAIKVISFASLGSTQSRERFHAEIQMAASLKHPNIVQLYSADEKDGVPYFVMEFVEGATLSEKIEEHPLEPRVAAETTSILAAAIQYCHERGIIHRDLKPSNVLIDHSGTPKIADFGLAKAFTNDIATTRTGEVLGTPAFMSPEQAAGNTNAICPGTDIYGLGSVLYHSLTGRPPFSAPSAAQTMRQVIEDDPISPRKLQRDIPRDIETICLKCLEKDPDRRYANAQELADDLNRFLNEVPILARPAGQIERAVKWTRRRPALAGLILLTAITIPATIGGLIFHTRSLDSALNREKEARGRVEQELQRAERLSELGSELSIWLLNEHSWKSLRQLPGSTQIQNDVNSRVQEYLVAATPDMPKNSKYLRRFAHAYSLLAGSQGGEGQSNLGQSELSLESYAAAMKLFDEALQLNPDDDVAKNLKIDALLGQADVQRLFGKKTESLASLAEAESLFESLQQKTSSDFRLIKLNLLQSKFANRFAENDFELALKTLETYQKSIEGGPADRLESSETDHRKFWYQKMRGNVLQAMGEPEKALGCFENAFQIAKNTYEVDPSNTLIRSRYATALIDLGDAYSGLRQHQAALQSFSSALEIRRIEVDDDPDDAMASHNLAVALSRVSGQHLQLSDPASHLDFALESVEIREALAEKQHDNLISQRDLGISLIGLAGAYQVNEQYAEAIDHYDLALDIAKRLMSHEDSKPAALNLTGESEFGRALTFFLMLINNLSDEDSIRDHPNFDQSMAAFKASLAAYDQIADQNSLTFDQEAFQAKVKQAQGFVMEKLKEMEESAREIEELCR